MTIIFVFTSAKTLYFADSHTAQIGRVLTNGRDYQTLHTSSQSADPFGIVKVVSSSDVDITRTQTLSCIAQHTGNERTKDFLIRLRSVIVEMLTYLSQDGFLYWTDWFHRGIQRKRLDSERVEIVGQRFFLGLNEILYFSNDDAQPAGACSFHSPTKP